jgi:hypothetical protein
MEVWWSSWCNVDTPTLEIREEEVEDQEDKKELDVGLEVLADKYGVYQLKDALSKLSER